MMLTIDQIRAARALLDWSQQDLAEHADLSQTGIARIENKTNKPNSKTLQKIESAFDRADIEFIGTSGLRKRRGQIRTLKGAEGLEELTEEIYEVTKETEVEVLLYNAKPQNWHKWLGKEYWDMHAERMRNIKDGNIQRNVIAESNDFTISSIFAEHRAFPDNLFSDQSIYTYGSKLAFVSFTESDVVIQILDNKHFSDAFRVLYDIAWENVAKPMD